MKEKINIKGTKIALYQRNESDFISLTDIARFKDHERSDYILQNWLRNRGTIEFLGLWEKINNPNFKSIEFDGFKNESGSNSFSLTPKRWIEKTEAIGIISKKGRYHSGTFAHKDIAFEFASWISPEFKLYLIKEFQRLKEEENIRKELGWDIKRNLTKINYRIHTDAIKENLIPQKASKKNQRIIYASEAEVLNLALFDKTSSQWKEENPDKEGNMRDYATVEQLVVLANLESMNAELIKLGIEKIERFKRLNEMAITQMRSLLNNSSTKKLTS